MGRERLAYYAAQWSTLSKATTAIHANLYVQRPLLIQAESSMIGVVVMCLTLVRNCCLSVVPATMAILIFRRCYPKKVHVCILVAACYLLVKLTASVFKIALPIGINFWK